MFSSRCNPFQWFLMATRSVMGPGPTTAAESSQPFLYATSMENTAVRPVCGAICAIAEAVHSKAEPRPDKSLPKKEFELFKTEQLWMRDGSIVFVHYGQGRDSDHQAKSGWKRVHSPTATGSHRLRGLPKPGGPHHASHPGRLPAETNVRIIIYRLFTLARISRHCCRNLCKGEPEILIRKSHAG